MRGDVEITPCPFDITTDLKPIESERDIGECDPLPMRFVDSKILKVDDSGVRHESRALKHDPSHHLTDNHSHMLVCRYEHFHSGPLYLLCFKTYLGYAILQPLFLPSSGLLQTVLFEFAQWPGLKRIKLGASGPAIRSRHITNPHHYSSVRHGIITVLHLIHG